MIKKKQATIGKRTLKTKLPRIATSKNKYTDNIEILGVGQSLQDERFLQVAVGDKTTLLNVDNLADPNSGELQKLTPLLPPPSSPRRQLPSPLPHSFPVSGLPAPLL
jgi:hypothetical protein